MRIPESERLPKHKILGLFKEEMPGILAWLVKGCLDHQRIGLNSPKKVLAATKQYRDEMDIIGDFISDCCEEDPAATVTAKELYENYEAWCESNGEKPISKTLLGMKLKEKGFDSYRASKGVRTWRGIALG